MNLEKYLDNHLESDVMNIKVLNFDGTDHNDVDYEAYEVIKTYRHKESKNVIIIVKKYK